MTFTDSAAKTSEESRQLDFFFFIKQKTFTRSNTGWNDHNKIKSKQQKNRLAHLVIIRTRGTQPVGAVFRRILSCLLFAACKSFTEIHIPDAATLSAHRFSDLQAPENFQFPRATLKTVHVTMLPEQSRAAPVQLKPYRFTVLKKESFWKSFELYVSTQHLVRP